MTCYRRPVEGPCRLLPLHRTPQHFRAVGWGQQADAGTLVDEALFPGPDHAKQASVERGRNTTCAGHTRRSTTRHLRLSLPNSAQQTFMLGPVMASCAGLLLSLLEKA